MVLAPFMVFGQSLGDTNHSGAIDIVDALLIAQAYVGLNPANYYATEADTNCSGSVDIVDALLIAQLYVGLIGNLPCQNTSAPTATPTSIPTATPTAVPTATPVTGSCSGTSGNVYLTFDDGPTGNTPTIVNNLKNAGACKATFFVIGQNMPGNSSNYKNAGYSVQNHTQTHPHMGSYSYQQVQNEIQQCDTAIQNAGFPKSVAIRLPYLENSSTIQSVCSAMGIQIISPSVDTQDWNGASTASIVSVASNISAGQNPLMHENQANTVGAVSTIVTNLKNKGLGFTQY